MSETCVQKTLRLRNFLRYCSGEQFLAQWPDIFTFIKEPFDDLKPFEHTTQLDQQTKCACLLLSDFLPVCLQFPAVSRQIGLEKLPLLLGRIFKTNSCDVHIFVALAACLEFYPDACAKFVSKSILPLIQLTVDEQSYSLQKMSAKCLALLPLVGVQGEKRVKRAENFSRQLEFLVGNISQCLDTFFISKTPRNKNRNKKLPEIVNFNGLKFEAFSNSALEMEKIVDRTRFCCKVLKFMLDDEYPEKLPVQIPIEDMILVLKNFSEAFGMHREMRKDVLKSLTIMTSLYTEILILLPNLLKLQLVPYLSDFLDCIQGILHHAHHSQLDLDRKFLLNSVLFSTLHQISLNFGVCGKMDDVLRKMWPDLKRELSFAVKSISQNDQSETLNDNPNGSNQGKKRKHSKIYQTPSSKTTDFGDQFVEKRQNFGNFPVNFSSICDFLQSTLLSCGSLLKPGIYRDIQKFCCKLLLGVKCQQGQQSLMENKTCVLKLLAVLETAIFCRNPKCPPAVHAGLKIFHLFSNNDTNAEIAQLSKIALLKMSALTKPRVPCMEKIHEPSEKDFANKFSENMGNNDETYDEVLASIDKVLGAKSNVSEMAEPDSSNPIESIEPLLVETFDGRTKSRDQKSITPALPISDSDQEIEKIDHVEGSVNMDSKRMKFNDEVVYSERERTIKNLEDKKLDSSVAKLASTVDKSEDFKKSNLPPIAIDSVNVKPVESIKLAEKFRDLIADFVDAPAEDFDDI